MPFAIQTDDFQFGVTQIGKTKVTVLNTSKGKTWQFEYDGKKTITNDPNIVRALMEETERKNDD